MDQYSDQTKKNPSFIGAQVKSWCRRMILPFYTNKYYSLLLFQSFAKDYWTADVKHMTCVFTDTIPAKGFRTMQNCVLLWVTGCLFLSHWQCFHAANAPQKRTKKKVTLEIRQFAIELIKPSFNLRQTWYLLNLLIATSREVIHNWYGKLRMIKKTHFPHFTGRIYVIETEQIETVQLWVELLTISIWVCSRHNHSNKQETFYRTLLNKASWHPVF